MLLVEENHSSVSTSTHADHKMLYIEEQGPVVVEVEASKKEGIFVMPIVVPDPPEIGGVEAVPRTGKGNPPRKVGTAARKDTRSGGRSVPIQRNPHPDFGRPNREIGNDHTTLRAPSESEIEWVRPS